LVPQRRGLLETQLVRGLLHARLQIIDHVVGLAIQKTHGLPDIALIILFIDEVDAWRRTAPDLILQTGAGALGKYSVLAGAQTKHPRQDLYGFSYSQEIRIRPEKPSLAAGNATIVCNPRIVMSTDHQVRV